MNSKNSSNRILIIIGLSTILYVFLNQYFSQIHLYFKTIFGSVLFSYLLTLVVTSSPLLLSVFFIKHYKLVFESVGLNKSIIAAIAFSFICTLPMQYGYAFFFEFNNELTFNKIAKSGIMAAFFEELVFRGILFGLVFRYTRLGFISSVLFGALLFGFAHVYQSQDALTLVGIFLATFLGSILFSWVYVEWNYNLWIPIFIHLFMNLIWMLFNVSDNASGGWAANIFRALTIALVFIITIRFKRKRNQPFVITTKYLIKTN